MNVKDYINGLLGDIKYVRGIIRLRRNRLAEHMARVAGELEDEMDPVRRARLQGLIDGMFEGARVADGAMAYINQNYPEDKRPRLRLLKNGKGRSA